MIRTKIDTDTEYLSLLRNMSLIKRSYTDKKFGLKLCNDVLSSLIS